MNKTYAGIGSRKTPWDICLEMRTTAVILALSDFTLRSGRAFRADQAFEMGCDDAGGKKEIFLPIAGFPRQWNEPEEVWRPRDLRKHVSVWSGPSQAAFEMARALLDPQHWHLCGNFGRLAHARNCHQILGWDLASPVDFVLAYSLLRDGKPTGGTATAIRIAEQRGIKVYNFAIQSDLEEWRSFQHENFVGR